MPEYDDACALARALVDTANGAGCRAHALITDMNQPLAASAGNALEVAEVAGALTGTRVAARLTDLSVELGAEVLLAAGSVTNSDAGARIMRETLRTGAAAEAFSAMIAAQGGPVDFLAKWQGYLPKAKVSGDVTAPRAGFVTAINGRAIGEAVVHLGGGRLRGGDTIDPSVGFSDIVRLGQKLDAGDPLAQVHARNEGAAEIAARALRDAITLAETPQETPPLIYERLT
jgi:thymidine phosphorylase